MEQETNMSLTNLTILQLAEHIINATKHRNFSDKSITEARPYVNIFAERLSLTFNESLILCAMLNSINNHTQSISDLSSFFKCAEIHLLTYFNDLTALIKKKYVRRTKDYEGEECYYIPHNMIDALRDNHPLFPTEYKIKDAIDWEGKLGQLLDMCSSNKLDEEAFLDEFNCLCKAGESLPIVSAYKKYAFPCTKDLLIFSYMLHAFVTSNDEHICDDELKDLLDDDIEMHGISTMLERGIGYLFDQKLIDYAMDDGQIVTNEWRISDEAKKIFLKDFKLKPRRLSTRLRDPKTITLKRLYYPENVSKQVQELRGLLEEKRFHKIQQNLQNYGMRRGFACIFYGAPGTGKTETALQLARETGRYIMQVDIPSLRSKWVGDTEKNVKTIFDAYREQVQMMPKAPILLFNEADAVFCKRAEGATDSIDKMENAMQNIILQELETLDGILIATTNLTGNLDDAFERRFLYKIEFTKPTSRESKYIWHTMLPNVSNKDILILARKYSFSGGQIENIARKQIIHSILTEDEQEPLKQLIEACNAELFTHNKNKRIGFY